MKLINADKCEKGLRANIAECVTSGKFAEADKWNSILEYIQSVPSFCDSREEKHE